MKEYRLAANIRLVLILFTMITVATLMPQDVYGGSASTIRLLNESPEGSADLTAANPFYVNGEAKSGGILGSGGCTAHFNASTGTLTLNGYNDGMIYTFDSANPGDVNIILQGANTIENAGIDIEGNLTISGTGSLTINNGGIRSSKGSINIIGGNLKIDRIGTNSSDNYGIYTFSEGKNITIGGSTLLEIKVKNGYWAYGIGASNGDVHITGNSQVNINAKDGTTLTGGIVAHSKNVTVDTKGKLKIITEGSGASAMVSSLTATSLDYIITGGPSEKDFEMVFAGIAANVSKISTKTPPKTDYGEGETLNLAGLVAVLHHPDTGLEEVSFENFETRGITTSLPQGKVLTTADTQVVLTHTASGKSISLPINVVVEPLVFNHDNSFNIPEDEIGKQVVAINLASGLQGGTLPYTYGKEGIWPDWLNLDESTGVISGTRPNVGQAEMPIKAKVTDSAGETVVINLTVGAVHYKPIKIVVPSSSYTFYVNKEKPYFNNFGTFANIPGNRSYGYYDIYTKTLTLDKLSSFGGYIDVEQGHINIMIAGGTSDLGHGRIIADGDININGEGRLDLGNLYYMGNIWSKNGDIDINSGEIILYTGTPQIAGESTIHHGIRAEKGSVTVGGNTKLDIDVASSGSTNYGIYAQNTVNIVDRADVTIIVRNGTSNIGIYNGGTGPLNITTKNKLEITTSDRATGGKNLPVYNTDTSKIVVTESDYTISIVNNTSHPYLAKRSYTYKGDPSDVRAIKVKTLPVKTSYFVGQKLDLTGLVVTLEKKEGVPNLDVAFADFQTHGITVTPKNKDRLAVTDTTIVFNHNQSGSRGEMPISVNQTPLTFIYSEDYDIPVCKVGNKITTVDISDGVFGGTGPYTYSIESPSWENWRTYWPFISPNGGISSAEQPFMRQPTSALIKIKDSTGQVVQQNIKVGGVASKDNVRVMGKVLSWEKPYLLVGGEPTATPSSPGVYNAYYDACTRTLYLKDYVASETVSTAIYSYSPMEDLTIDLSGYNEFNGSVEVEGNGYLTIKGSGTLKLVGKMGQGIVKESGSVTIKSGTVSIDLETTPAENYQQKGIVVRSSGMIIEGDSKVNIDLRGNGYKRGIEARYIQFAGNSRVGITVVSDDGFGIEQTDKDLGIEVTTTDMLSVMQSSSGFMDKKGKFYCEEDNYYVIHEQRPNGLYFHNYLFKSNLPDYAPYVKEIKVAKRPNQPIIYYNQILDLSGLEVELIDQYGNKTLVALEQFEEKGITTSESHGSVFPSYSNGDLIIKREDSEGHSSSVAMPIILESVDVSVQSVSLNKNFTQIIMGSSEKLTATVTPSNATNKQIIWSSNNPSVASVDGDGNVTAHKIGTARITVRTADGNKTAICDVIVQPPAVRVSGVLLDKLNVDLFSGDTEKLTAIVIPSNAVVKTVEWSTSNSAIVTVDQQGNIRAIAPGTATVTVTTNDGGYTKNCIVRVKGDGVSVSGEISFWDNQNNLVIKLYNATVSDADIREDMKNGTPALARGDVATLGIPAAAGSNKYTQTFSFEGVEDGSYKVAVYRPKYIVGIVEFTATGNNVHSLDLLLWQRGDVNGDGKINSSDRQRLYEHLNGTKPLGTDALKAADVNQDGKVNSSDRQRLYEHLNGTKPLV